MSDMHTPLPWNTRLSRDGSGDVGITADGLPNVLAEVFGDIHYAGERNQMEATANAELIVTAVNERPALLARASQDAETIKALRDDRYDQGRRDVLNAILALNPKAEALLAGLHEREPNSMGQLPFDVVVWVTEVAEQLGIKPKDEDRAALAGSAP